MTYWRMQLHPSEPEYSTQYASESLAAGFIGLDFKEEVGNLTLTTLEKLPDGQKDYMDFATKMKEGDKVLVIVHHFPFAVVTIEGQYNYILRPEPELGVWFRHFRRVKDVKYYADFITNAKAWESITMTDTISILRDQNSKSFKLIEEMTKRT